MHNSIRTGIRMLLLALAWSAWAQVCHAEKAVGDTPEDWADARGELAKLGEGFVIWESDRSGTYSLWRIELTGAGLQKISPEEDREHYCPHISPDGEHVVFLSYPKGWRTYDLLKNDKAPLWIMNTDGSGPRILIPDARMFGEDRAVVWLNAEELMYIGPDRMTYRLNIRDGRQGSMLAAPSSGKDKNMQFGWLIDPSLKFASQGRPSFAPYNSEAGTISERSQKGGCQPYFTRNGEWGFWMGGAGGPIKSIHLPSGKEGVILNKNDPRMPKDRGYLYFPMVSACGRLIAFAASTNQHDHFKSNYDIFVAPLDPATLQVNGKPVRLTFENTTDRFPDVFLKNSKPLQPGVHFATGPTNSVSESLAEDWKDHDGLLFRWDNGKADNLVSVPGSKEPRTFALAGKGPARLDRHHAMRPAGGSFIAPDADGQVLAGCKATHELSIMAVISPSLQEQNGPARIVSFSDSISSRNFTLGQEGRQLVLRLRTSGTDTNGNKPQVQLFDLTPDTPVHAAVTYSDGQLIAYKNGIEVMRTDRIRGNFENWTAQQLIFGDEIGGGRSWRGSLEKVAIHNKTLSATQIAKHYQEWNQQQIARSKIENFQVEARLLSKSKIPTLQEIQPYKEGLAVYEYEVVKSSGKFSQGDRIRVAHWIYLNGVQCPAASLKENALATLKLEALADQAQVQSHYLSDTLAENFEIELYFETSE